jgi:hypothetical protein
MKIEVSSRLKIAMSSLFVGAFMILLAAYFFRFGLDPIVNIDLYNFGLTPSQEWQGRYWQYSAWINDFRTISLIATFMSVAFVEVYARNKSKATKLVGGILLAVSTLMIVLSTFFFYLLDAIVNIDLYNYGLQYSSSWVEQYQLYKNLIFGLSGAAIAATVIALTVILPRARTSIEVDSTKLFFAGIFSTGVVALVFSISYSSSILALIGLGLVFWGAILLYIEPGEYVKAGLFDSTTIALLESLDSIIREGSYKGEAIYLPPRYLKDFESSKVYLSKEKRPLPSPEQIRQKEELPVSFHSDDALLNPPGAELARLFERSIGTSFTKVDLRFLENSLPTIVIDKLEIAGTLRIYVKRDRIEVDMENPIYKDIFKQISKLPDVVESLGDPISSAIACALAKATGKPVKIAQYEINEDGETVSVVYLLIEEQAQDEERPER